MNLFGEIVEPKKRRKIGFDRKAYYKTYNQTSGRQAKHKLYYQVNKEKINAYGKLYNQVNKEKKKAYRNFNSKKIKIAAKLYRQANADKIKINYQLYHKLNPEKRKLYYQNNQEKINTYRQSNKAKAKGQSLFRNYGITMEQYNEMLISQNNVCAICFNPETAIHYKYGIIRGLAVDHCHKTNKVRGLLCNRCNITIGFFDDDIKLFESAIKYLKSHSD